MRKRMTVLLICVSLILLIAGCGNKGKQAGNEENGSKSGTGQTVTLSISMHVANVKDQEPAMYGIVQKFQELNPDIKIDLSGEDTETHVKKMKMQAQVGSLPDIFWILPAPAKEMNHAGLLLDFSEFLKKNPEVEAAINPNMLKSYSENGKQYGLPYGTLVTGLWYNQALFDKYGVKVPETYEELLEAAKVFKANNVVTIAKGARDAYSTWAFLGMLTRYGFFEKIDNILAGKEKFNNPDFLRFFEKIEELRKAGAFPENVSTLNYFQAVEMFTSGKAAMLDAGAWETKKIEQSPVVKTVGFSWGPTFADGVGNQKIAMIVATAPLVASAEVKNDPAKYEAVQRFFKFYYSQEGAQVMVDNGVPPVVKFTGNVDDKKFPVFAKLMKQMSEEDWERPVAQPDLVLPDSVASALNDSIYGVITGVYTPAQALDRIDKAISQQ